MAHRLRGAVIGCGFFAQNHLHAWAGLEGVEIVAVCDLDPAKVAHARTILPAARGYADAAAMLEAERPDFADIATTVQTHRSLVELCAASEAAVICQKPIAHDLAEARAMVEACDRAGVPYMVHENFRFQSPQIAVKQVLEQGGVGRPFFARISFRHGYDIYANQPYLLTEERHAIYDLGVHLLDLARFYLGEVVGLTCRTDRIDPRVRGEDTVVMLLDHAGGARCVVDFSHATRAEPDLFPQTLVRIEGDAGTVELTPGYRLVVSRPGLREERTVEPPVPSWGERPWHVVQDSVINTQRHWLDCLRSGRLPATAGRDNLRTFALVEAAYASAATGRAVAPEL